MTLTTTTPPALGIDQLSYACVDAKPIDYDFSGDNFGESEGRTDGTGWSICPGSLVPEDLETEIYDLHVGVNVTRDVELDLSDFEITVTTTRTTDEGDEDEDVESYSPGDDKWSDLLFKHFGLDGEEIQRQIDGEDYEDWFPQMNYAYPLDREPPEDWKAKVNNCTCVEIDGNYYLALTGGGMDFSWEICESYMRLGYYPPAHFASDLPRMAGRGTSERDKWIIEGCRKSLEGMRDRMVRAIERLDQHVVWAKEEAG